ncbi:unnamed protein product [Caretta caretta]
MDRGSRFFYALEKMRGAKKHVTCLLAEAGTLLMEPAEMRAVLALLPKKGDLRDLQNWCPLSLLSTDYKIVVKAILLRLGSVLADMIHPDQTYTILDCSIFDNLFLVQDLLKLGRRDGLLFALLSLDQEKAFDRVDHGYLLSTLQAFGFRSQFVGFLRVLYASAECLVKLNWTLTEPVSFGRLTGLVLREPELRLVLLAYADDMLLVVQDPGDLAREEACQAIYSAAFSSQVNWGKSSGLALNISVVLDLIRYVPINSFRNPKRKPGPAVMKFDRNWKSPMKLWRAPRATELGQYQPLWGLLLLKTLGDESPLHIATGDVRQHSQPLTHRKKWCYNYSCTVRAPRTRAIRVESWSWFRSQ